MLIIEKPIIDKQYCYHRISALKDNKKGKRQAFRNKKCIILALIIVFNKLFE